MNIDLILAETQFSAKDFKKLVKINKRRRGYFQDWEWERLEQERRDYMHRVTPEAYDERMQIEAQAQINDDAWGRTLILAAILRFIFKTAKYLAIAAIPVGIFAAGVAVGVNFF